MKQIFYLTDNWGKQVLYATETPDLIIKWVIRYNTEVHYSYDLHKLIESNYFAN